MVTLSDNTNTMSYRYKNNSLHLSKAVVRQLRSLAKFYVSMRSLSYDSDHSQGLRTGILMGIASSMRRIVSHARWGV